MCRPRAINAAADANETLKELIPAVAAVMPPQKMIALVDAYIETSMLPSEMKQKYRQQGQQQQQPDPAQQQAQQIQMAQEAAKAKETEASAGLKAAQTQKTVVETQLLPQKQAHDQAMEHTNLAHDAMNAIHDRHNAAQDRMDGMMSDHADRHQAAVMRQADMFEGQQARDFQGQQSEADRAAQQEAMRQKMQQQQAAPV